MISTSRKNLVVAMVCALVCLATAAKLPGVVKAAQDQAIKDSYHIVTTLAGPLEGVKDKNSGMYMFLGVPYAKPPTGDLRFQAPVAPSPWTLPKAARYFAPACPQLEEQHEKSEDCLALNVWTPDTKPKDGESFPVMVFIHGGGFVEGSTASSLYDGTSFAERGIVFVSIAYRLGLLGWFDLSNKGPGFEGRVNNGLKDQILALEWVQDNIGSFGGDKNRVTVMGHAAGSVSITAMLALPQPERLMSRAILMSGGDHWVHTKRQSKEVSEWIVRLARTIYTEGDTIDLQLLMESTDADLVELQSVAEYYSGVLDQQLFAPTIDGELLTQDPLTAVEMGNAAKVDVLVGSVKDEINMWLDMLTATPQRNFAYYPWPLPLLEPDLDNPPQDMEVSELLTEVVKDDFFQEYCANCDQTMKLLYYFSHLMVHNDVVELAAAQAKHNPKTFVYRFNWVSPDHYDWGSPQGLDLGFVFDALHETKHVTGEVSVPKHLLADTMQSLWTEFVYTGDMSKLADKPDQFWFEWPAFTADEPSALEINDLSHGRIKTTKLKVAPYSCEDEANGVVTLLPNLCRKYVNWDSIEHDTVKSGNVTVAHQTRARPAFSGDNTAGMVPMGNKKKHNKQRDFTPKPALKKTRGPKKTGLQYLAQMVFGDAEAQEL